MSLTSSHFNHQISSIALPKKIEVKENGEVILLKEGPVEITNLSLMIGQKTYAISNIHSVHGHTYEPKLFLFVFFILIVAALSALVALLLMEIYSENTAVGLVIGLVGLMFLGLSTKTKYSVCISSSKGELKILESSDKNFVERTADAINRAIFLREFN
jgi:Family of unknown function (DUF6232)